MSASELTPLTSDVSIRPCGTREEFEQCVELQKVVWGYSNLDVVPASIFIVASRTGGHVVGAFQGGTLVGFALGFCSVRKDGLYVHSHMVAVDPKHQDCGVGRALKLQQREECLRNGMRFIEWTFDPLELKNARFNILRLGAIVRRYVPNLYGVTSSRLHGNLPTDRLVAEWQLDSPRVRAILDKKPYRPAQHAKRINVPVTIGEMKQTDLAAARLVQERVQKEFGQLFEYGYAVTYFELREDVASYVLEPYED
jgi:predicted GNAT superfamily acetyltransferase